MADFETGDVVRLGMVHKLDLLSDIVNVVHVQITAGGGLDFAAAALDFQQYTAALMNTIVTIVVNNMVAEHVSVKNITRAAVWGNIAWDGYTIGSNVSEATAAQVAVLAWGRTSRSRVQIRKYLGVFGEPQMTDGVWTSATRVLCNNFIDYHIVGQTMDEGLVLRGCAFRPSDSRVTFAITGTTSAMPVIQRRRRVGRGS